MHPLSYLPHSPGSRALAPALLLSVVLHAALLFSAGNLVSQTRPAAKMTEDLKVRLVTPPPPLSAPVPAPQPELHMREDTPRKRVTAPLQKPAPKAARAPTGIQMLAGDAARKAGEQIARELFYPPEAIERGLEGEALVLLFLDESGNAIAARIEASSGHALLDAAAVRAARTLRAMPASAPREAVLPVRFRLR